MLTLRYEDLSNSGSYTYKVFDRLQEEIEWLEKKLARKKQFDLMLTNYVQTHGTMSRELYNTVCAMFEHSDKSVPEIFKEIDNRG